MREVEIVTEDETFSAELADNFLRRAKGLSFRSEGKMLFVFSYETIANIDMMFLSRTLWLYFLDRDKRVIEVQKAEPWTWSPKTWKLYSPKEKYRYLLESFEPLDIRKGDEIEFDIP